MEIFMSLANTRYGYSAIKNMFSGKKAVFFCGIGGINMSSLAHITRLMGYNVFGSDRTKTPLTERLENEGIKISYCHKGENVSGADVFVYTVAISEDNPEYQYAKNHNIPTVSRADYLGYIMYEYQNRIGVAGSHGKSTTTSMLAHIFTALSLDPTVVSGAEYAEMGGAYRIGGKEHFIFESCEYMDNFLSFYPTVCLVLNMEFDHGDYFSDMAAVRDSFRRYATMYGYEKLIYNSDCENSRVAFMGLPAFTFGIDHKADIMAEDIGEINGDPVFTAVYRDGERAKVALSVGGSHNVYNALAALSVCELLNIDRQSAAMSVTGFTGAKRRMEYKKTVLGANIFEDYAHHPTEIKTTVETARKKTKGRVITVFQPHTYSRTKELFSQFAEALSASDITVLTDIYSAREADTLGVSSELLAQNIKGAIYGGDIASTADIVKSLIKEGDTVLVMGAGDVIKITPML